jgi:UPF0755 protein
VPKRKLLITLLSFTLIIFILLSGVFYFSIQPPAYEKKRFLSFSITVGESFKAATRRLKTEGFIKNEAFFYYMGRLTSKSGKIKAGEYELNTEMTAWEILNVITGGRVKLYRITIKEGMTMFQVAEELERLGLMDQVKFIEAAWNPLFLEELMIPSVTVEGYLFPETYYIPRGSSARSIIKLFVDMFWTRVDEEYINKTHMSIHDIVIMASMIEKETGLSGEMGLISSVFHNRYRKGMKFQSDPTSIYNTKPYGGKPQKADIRRSSPFNTYRIKGLPLTPISNPGILAIHATAFPQTTDYLFFVSKNDGSHYFSKNYAEHERAINRFLRNRRKKKSP